MSSLRAFIALELPHEVKQALSDFVVGLRKSHPDPFIRWLPVANIHLTLKFLGDIEESALSAIGRALAELARETGPIGVGLSELAIFPALSRARGVWIGVADTGGLSNCAARIDEALVELGYPSSKRLFNPHLTLARFRRNMPKPALKKLAQKLSDRPILPVQSVALNKLILYESELHPDGAQYTARLVYSLQDGRQED